MTGAASALPGTITFGAGESLLVGRAIGTDILLLACIMLSLLAAFAFAALFSARRERRFAARLARRRGVKMNELIRTMRMAEHIAGLGVWQYDPQSGAQQWSAGMRKLFGVDHDEPFLPGDAETLLYANDIDLIGAVAKKLDETGSYELHFEVHGYDGEPRSISLQVFNIRDRSREVVRVVAILRDNTEQVARLRELESSRAAAERDADLAREMAQTDPLTGLANRRRVMERLDHMIVEARQTGLPMMLVVFDIDHFKAVNDTYGHAEGDRILQNVARIARSQARDGDVIGRVGGEEFVWVVPGASENVSRVMTERLRQAVSLQSATDTASAVTISVGIAALAPGDSSLTLFARADAALYEAKHAGRNRVRMAA